jgi:hypothetical protein
MVVHRLERATDLKSPKLLGRIVAFCGDGDSLTVHQLYEDLFHTSKGPAGSVDFLNSVMEHLSVDETLWTASPSKVTAVDFSEVEVPHSILVPPKYVERLLKKKSLTPRELWTEVVADIILNGNVGTYTRFVEWARRALTNGGDGIRGVLDYLDPASAVTWKATRLAEDLPGHHAARVVPIFPFCSRGTKVFHKPNVDLEVEVVDVLNVPPANCDYLEDLDSEGGVFMAGPNTVNAERLCEYVSDAGGSYAWAWHALMLADGTPPFVDDFPPEAFLQQHAFGSVSSLLYSFRPTLFTKDIMLKSPHDLADGNPLYINPGAAIRVCYDMDYIFCLMALKQSRRRLPTVDQAEMLKLVLFTFMSALALREHGFAESISIPFVMGVGEYAHLFVTELGTDSKVPSVKWVYGTSMRERSHRAHLFKYLCVLLSRIVKAIHPSVIAALRRLHGASLWSKSCRTPSFISSPGGCNQVVGSNEPGASHEKSMHSPGLPPLVDSDDCDLKEAPGAIYDFRSSLKAGRSGLSPSRGIHQAVRSVSSNTPSYSEGSEWWEFDIENESMENSP